MYGSSVAGGHGQVSEDPEERTDEQPKEESVPLPSLRTLKRKAAFSHYLQIRCLNLGPSLSIYTYFRQDG